MTLDLGKVANPAAVEDILELQRQISAFQAGDIPTDKFGQYRLTRGIYGQRQANVQMIRIKIPYGKVTADQLDCIADVSEKYSNGNLHLTTRQDIQVHYVKLADTPALWADLEATDVTLREACGNTVRNVTASARAGIDPLEPFDVTPYAHTLAHYFLRNPICQELGRKFKIAFSSSSQDTALTFFHDLGLIPLVRTGANGTEERGFKVVVGGGLGAQPYYAQTAHEFLPTELLIPFTEAVLRVFDRHGERTRRHKARIKYLVHGMGIDAFLQLVNDEMKAVKHKVYPIDPSSVPPTLPPAEPDPALLGHTPHNEAKYADWLKLNTFEQKQAGYHAVQLKITVGDIHFDKAHLLADLVRQVAADDIRITVNQGFLLKYIRPELLPYVFNKLDELGLAEPGFDTLADITACPGTDTCNLGIASSYGLARVLEQQIHADYYDLMFDSDIRIKISGCMNSCGQHEAATLGFHGSSLKAGNLVVPAMQVVMGGGVDALGKGYIADKVVKVPTKRVPLVLQAVIADFQANATDGETFLEYYLRQGKQYFYTLLKPLADLKSLTDSDYTDWAREQPFETEVGVGECVGKVFDLVSIIFTEADQKLAKANTLIAQGHYVDAIYYAYSAQVTGAKGFLLSHDVACNTQIGILNDFQALVIDTGQYPEAIDFKAQVLEINQNEPDADFATRYAAQATAFLGNLRKLRDAELVTA